MARGKTLHILTLHATLLKKISCLVDYLIIFQNFKSSHFWETSWWLDFSGKLYAFHPFKYWTYRFFWILNHCCNKKSLLCYLFRTLAKNLILFQYYLIYWQSSSQKQNIYVSISQQKKRQYDMIAIISDILHNFFYLQELISIFFAKIFVLHFWNSVLWDLFCFHAHGICKYLHFSGYFELRNRTKIISSRLPLFL